MRRGKINTGEGLEEGGTQEERVTFDERTLIISGKRKPRERALGVVTPNRSRKGRKGKGRLIRIIF